VIRVHFSVEEVDSGVLRADRSSPPSLQEVVFARGAGGCAFPCFAPAFPEIVEEGFLYGRSAMRCRVPSSSGTPTVGVLGPTAHPGLPLEVLFWSRTVLPTVAQWFVPDARETVDNLVHVRAALRCVIPYVLVWIFCVVGYKGVL
jgi:hypothetical protein